MRVHLTVTVLALLGIGATTAFGATSTTSLGSSQNPATYGQAVTFQATVTGGAGMPTGTVKFKDGSTVIASAVALDTLGVARFTTSTLTVASHNITASYSGDATYTASTSPSLSQVVGKAGTTIALASSLNPACAGQPVTLTATVTVVAPGAGVPTGTVSFKDGGTSIASIALNGSAVATFTTSALSATNHNLTAVYNGSGSFSTSTSTPTLVQTVKAKPSAAVSGSTAICPGGSATIQAALGGTSPWTVTWSDGMVQSGLVTSPATRSVSPSATTIYSVTNVADASCSNSGSGSATVTVNTPPAITGQPANRTVCEGSTGTFTVAATGSGLTYRWRKDGINLVNGGNVSGATSATLSISSAAPADAGSYDVVVTGTCPSALTSNAATLAVAPIPTATISAVALLCAGSTSMAAVSDAGPGAQYAWTITNGTVTRGAGTSAITYAAGASGSSLTLKVTVTNASGCSVSGSQDVAVSTGDVAIEDWKNIPAGTESWQSATLQTKDMMYPEGGTVPYRLTLPQPCVGSAWSITLEYDFADQSTGVHFCDFLTSYNAYEASATGHGSAGRTYIGETTFPIPADASLSYQLPGVFTVENGSITGVSAYSTISTGGSTRKHITLTGTATSSADVMVLFGVHLARDYEWGTDKGAHEWPTGTASIGFVSYSGGSGNSTAGHTNVKVSDNILDNPSQSDLSVVATDTPDPVSAGQNLTYSIIVSNSGPLSSIADTLSDSIPAGTTFVSATAPAGWTLTTPAVGATGTVRWILPASFNAGASATFGLVVAVSAAATGTVENTATLTAGNVDAYQPNNSSHTSTTINAPAGLVSVSPVNPANPGGLPSAGDGEVLPRSGNDRPGSHGSVPGPGPAGGSGQPGNDEDPIQRQGHAAGTGPAPASGTPTQSDSGTVSQRAATEVPANDATLERPSPNPFRISMHMAYAVPVEQERVEISVYDVAGRRVRVLANGMQSPGRHDVAWDGRDESGAPAARGMYFVRLQIGNQAHQVRVTSVN